MAIETISRPFTGVPRPQSRAQRLAVRFNNAIRRRLEALVPETKHPRADPGLAVDATARPITLVCISDTHNDTSTPLPPGDILLHAGDLSQFDTFAEIQAQLTWLAAQPHQHKIIIAGNHDLLLDSAFVAAHPDRELDRYAGKRRADLDWGGVRYLEHESLDLEVEGKGRSVRVFGSLWTLRSGNWAFQYGQDGGTHKAEGGREAPMNWAGAVPGGTSLLIVHGPPKAHLDDGGKGCMQLLAELWRTRPKVVVCGHIHTGRGIEWLPFNRAQSWYESTMLGRRQWISVACLVVWNIWLMFTKVFGTTKKSGQQTKGTLLVNAAVAGGRENHERRDAIVVAI